MFFLLYFIQKKKFMFVEKSKFRKFENLTDTEKNCL
ncbi:MAG: hypothetical protein ACI870_000092 [Crocinitomicaceae bacterium]|jgi:hypothetical protein